MTRQEALRLGHVALVIGGDTSEREVSLRGGRAVASALESLGIQFSVVDGPRRLLEQVAAGHYDRVFNLLHGRGGEDGALQGALRLYGVPVTGSGVLASALTMDKVQTKRIWMACDLPTPRWATADHPDQGAEIAERLGTPLFVKPSREGSSIGMSRVDAPSELGAAIALSLEHDDRVLVEQLVDGPEYTASVVDDQVLPLIGLKPAREFYDYAAKYESGDTQYLCPCGLPADVEAKLARLCLEAFRVVGATGWGRVDLMVDSLGQPYLLEVNTTPGMTEQSLVPKAAAAAGIDFKELVWRILNTSRID